MRLLLLLVGAVPPPRPGGGGGGKKAGCSPLPDPAAFPELTDREREILDLVARGRSNAEITAELVLSPKTVRNHVSNVFAKLQVRDRAEAIVRAREAGMGGARPG